MAEFNNPELIPDNYTLYSPLNPPFGIYGLQNNGEYYYRIPDNIAEKCNDGVKYLCQHTAGGRIRFITDAEKFSISADLHRVDVMEHFAFTGSAGFDVYTDNIYNSTVFPDYKSKEHIEAEVFLLKKGKKLITINLSTYAGIKNITLAFPKNSTIEPPTDYKIKKPVVFYGSSITQGGCCSRPGNTYQSILSRRLDFDFINLGFSGSAKGEDSITEYISRLDMSAFVLDYDHNAPTPEHLKNTHEKMYKYIRKRHPDLPVLLLTRPKIHLDNEEIERKNIVEATYNNAKQNGDNNIFFIPGNKLISDDTAECATVDNTHPNDAGFLSMANAIEPVLKKMIY